MAYGPPEHTAGAQYGQQEAPFGGGPGYGRATEPPAGGGQYGEQGTQPGGQRAQQFGGGQQYGEGAGRQPTDIKLEEGLTEEMRVVLHDLIQSATACEWCAERCIDEGPGMAECIRLCRDVADLATLNAQFISRDSVFGPAAIEVFADAAEACAQECARHGHRHCQECAEQLTRAVQSTRKMLASFEGGGRYGEEAPTAGSPRAQQSGQSPGQQYGQPRGQQYGESQGQQYQPWGEPGQQF
ncbi:MAG TPA: four-helix bundle copper-binding protein [Halobacteriales archaeon]|nr:four-helix bundle copper-binding protein [Halobacteriales archaeon]